MQFVTEYNNNIYDKLIKFNIEIYNEEYIANLVRRPANSAEDHVKFNLQSSTESPTLSPVPSPATRPVNKNPKYTTEYIYDTLNPSEKTKRPQNEIRNALGILDNYTHTIIPTSRRTYQNLIEAINRNPHISDKEKLKQKIQKGGGSTRKNKKNN